MSRAPLTGDALDAALFRFDTNTVVQASAGTGKTETLTTLYACCLAGAVALDTGRQTPAVPPERILAITFTEKAAGEMSERIREAVRRLAAGDTEGLLASRLAAQVARIQAERPGWSPPDAAGWAEIARRLTDATITTFHGFAGGLLRRHPVAAGVDPGYGLLDETEAQALADGACRRAVRAALAEAHPAVQALVRAWGYGTTVAQAHRTLAWLGERGVAPADLLDGSHLQDDAYAASAVADCRRRAEALAGAVADLAAFDAAWVNPDNRAALDALGPRADAVREVAGDPAPLAGAAAAIPGALAGVTQRKDGLGAKKKALRELAGEVAAAAARAASLPAARLLAEGLAEVVARAHADYAEAKAARDALDFRDLLIGARDLLAGHPAVRRAVQGRYDVVLVDEFQDTDPVQAQIVRLLRADDPDPGGDGARSDQVDAPLKPAGLFIVGDRKQSIYGFRGADVTVFEHLTEALEAAGGRRLALRTSYRSTPAVLATVNHLARAALEGDGESATGYHDDDDLVPALVPAPGDGDGPVAAADAPAVELFDGSAYPGLPPAVREARMVARRLAELCGEGGDGTRPGDVAVLLPVFTHLATWAEELTRAGLPFHVVKGRGFYDAQEVRDLARALTLLVDPGNPVALAAVLRSPLVALSDPGLALLAEAGDGRLDDRWLWGLTALPVALDAADAEALSRFAALHRVLARHGDRVGPTRTLETLLRQTGYRALLAALPDGAQKVANVDKVVAFARAREAAGHGDLQAFARELESRVEGARQVREQTAAVVEEAGGEAVRVLTVHQAKGLQFPVVALGGLARKSRTHGDPLRLDPDLGPCLKAPGPEDTLVPAGRFTEAGERAGAREAAERARLFYVALTRAKRRILLAGESGRRPPDGSERPLADAALDAGAGIVRRPFETLRAPPRLDDPPARVDLLTPEAAAAVVARVAPLTHLPVRRVFLPVTALQTFAECPRRYRAAFLLGLEEHPRARIPLEDPVADADRPGPVGDPRRRGSLVHALLEHADLDAFAALGRAHLEVIAPVAGVDAARQGELVDAAERFLSSGYGAGLRALPPEAVGREVPFLLAAEGGDGLVVHVKGQIDLLVQRGAAVEVVDYKLTRPRGDGPEAYRFQLECYGAAAAEGRPAPGDRAPPLRLGIQFLEGPAGAGPQWLEVPATPDAVVARVADLGRQLLESRARGVFEGHPRATCEALGCGYLRLCHGDGAGGAASGQGA